MIDVLIALIRVLAILFLVYAKYLTVQKDCWLFERLLLFLLKYRLGNVLGVPL